MASTFNDSAELYDAVRPGYPQELFDDVELLTGLRVGSRVLEVGCGTGQATVCFAERGYRVVCVDPGGALVGVARRKLAGNPVEFVASRFEDWPLTGQFDVVASGTAWHWVDPAVGYLKAAAALKDDGFIALFWNLHPTPYTGFFEAVQRVYGSVVPEWDDPQDRPSTEQRIEGINAEIEASGQFAKPVVKQYTWSRAYSKEDYLRLLDTYSDHRSLPGTTKERLYSGVGHLIEEEYGGRVERPYLTALFVARKAPR
ncbi:MAG: class I SAM-dependent methyltransferase [Candidatus Bathyarchaeota archaeon]